MKIFLSNYIKYSKQDHKYKIIKEEKMILVI